MSRLRSLCIPISPLDVDVPSIFPEVNIMQWNKRGVLINLREFTFLFYHFSLNIVLLIEPYFRQEDLSKQVDYITCRQDMIWPMVMEVMVLAWISYMNM